MKKYTALPRPIRVYAGFPQPVTQREECDREQKIFEIHREADKLLAEYQAGDISDREYREGIAFLLERYLIISCEP